MRSGRAGCPLRRSHSKGAAHLRTPESMSGEDSKWKTAGIDCYDGPEKLSIRAPPPSGSTDVLQTGSQGAPDGRQEVKYTPAPSLGAEAKADAKAYTDKRLHDNILYSGLPNLYDTFTLVASALQGEKIDTSKVRACSSGLGEYTNEHFLGAVTQCKGLEALGYYLLHLTSGEARQGLEEGHEAILRLFMRPFERASILTVCMDGLLRALAPLLEDVLHSTMTVRREPPSTGEDCAIWRAKELRAILLRAYKAEYEKSEGDRNLRKLAGPKSMTEEMARAYLKSILKRPGLATTSMNNAYRKVLNKLDGATRTILAIRNKTFHPPVDGVIRPLEVVVDALELQCATYRVGALIDKTHLLQPDIDEWRQRVLLWYLVRTRAVARPLKRPNQAREEEEERDSGKKMCTEMPAAS